MKRMVTLLLFGSTAVNAAMAVSILSPFGKASDADLEAAQDTADARKAAEHAWEQLPSRVKADVAAKIVDMSYQQKLVLINSVPELQQLSYDQKDLLPTDILDGIPVPHHALPR